MWNANSLSSEQLLAIVLQLVRARVEDFDFLLGLRVERYYPYFFAHVKVFHSILVHRSVLYVVLNAFAWTVLVTLKCPEPSATCACRELPSAASLAGWRINPDNFSSAIHMPPELNRPSNSLGTTKTIKRESWDVGSDPDIYFPARQPQSKHPKRRPESHR